MPWYSDPSALDLVSGRKCGLGSGNMYNMLILLVFYTFFFGVDASKFENNDSITDLEFDRYMSRMNVLSPRGFIDYPTYMLNSSFFIIGGLFSLRSRITKMVEIYQIQSFEAFRYAIDTLNLDTSVLPNTTLTYKFFESSYDIEYSLSASMAMASDNIIAIVGPETVRELRGSSPFTSARNQTLITPSFPGYVHDEFDNLFCRTITSQTYQAYAVVELLKYMNWSLVVPLYNLDPLSVLFTDTFYSELQGLISVDYTCGTALPTVSSVLQVPLVYDEYLKTAECISTSQANVVILATDYEHSLIMLKALSTFPQNSRLVVVSCTTMAPMMVDPFSASQDSYSLNWLRGHIILSPPSSDLEGFKNYLYSLNPSNNNYSYFVEAWQNSFRCLLNGNYPLCSHNISERSITPSCICTGQESYDRFPIYPICSCIFDAIRLIAAGVHNIKVSCSSLNSSAYSFCNSGYITGRDVYNTILRLELPSNNGILGLRHSEGLPSPITPCVEFLQFGDNGTFRVIGIYNQSVLKMYEESFSFKTTEPPASMIVPQDVSVTSIYGAAMFTFSVLVIVVCLIFCVIFYIKRNDPVIRKSSPLFCELTLFGLILVNTSLLVSCLPPSTSTCYAYIWLLLIGIAMILGALFAKTYRIFKIFSSVRVRATAIRDVDLLKFVGGSVLIAIILLVIVSFSNGSLELVVKYSTTDSLYSYYDCDTTGSDTVDTILLAIVDAVVVIAVLCLAIVTYLTRNVDSAYNESMYIGATIYCYSILLVISVPLLATNSVTSGYAVRVLLEGGVVTLVASVFTLIMLFGTKLYQSHKNHQEMRSRAVRTLSNITDSRIISRTIFYENYQSVDADQDLIGMNLSEQENLGFVTRGLWRAQEEKSKINSFRKHALSSTIFSKKPNKSGNIRANSSSDQRDDNVLKRKTIGQITTRRSVPKHRKRSDSLNVSLDSIGLLSMDNLLSDIQDDSQEQL